MNRKITQLVLIIFAIAMLLLGPVSFAAPLPDPNISVKGYFANDKAQRGRTVQAAVVIEIPSGYHINSNRPLESFLIATSLKIDAPGGVPDHRVARSRNFMRAARSCDSA